MSVPAGEPRTDYDVIVIGAGINGAGIARDAALRGLRTCIIDQQDAGAGTSRWSSRLIHGGLRYLEHGELGLVHESLRERELLLRQAPHLVRPLPLLIPIYAGSRRSLGTVDLGLWLYDLLSLGRSLPGHRRLSRDETIREVPGLRIDGLEGAASYFDAQVVFPERLVIELLLGARDAGAVIHTYTRVVDLQLAADRVGGVTVEGPGGARQALTAGAVVNAAGPWVDRILASGGRATPRLLGPTKGTHVVVPRIAGLAGQALYAEAPSDGRPFFIIPWNGLVLIGTTDTRFDGDPGAARPTEAEVAYLLEATRGVFPRSAPERQDVLYAYAGVRPLPRQGLRATGAITRRHQVRQHPTLRGLYNVLGGKLTTFRSLAEDAVDQVAARLGRRGIRCLTAATALPGGGATPLDIETGLQRFAGLSPQARRHLADIYGTRAERVAALTLADPDLAAPLCPASHAIAAEVVFAFQEEFATTLADVVFRRCMAGLGPDRGAGAIAAAVVVGARHLGWDEQRCQAERAACAAETALFTTVAESARL
jgi:glycerol-3-phosphate dehydrogenase